LSVGIRLASSIGPFSTVMPVEITIELSGIFSGSSVTEGTSDQISPILQ
jgi:hypothetical protein